MEQSSVILILCIIGLILIVLLIFFCCKDRNNNDRRSSSSSIESFQQLYFTQTPYDKIKNLEQQRVIERWSSANQPSTIFYRVYIQDNPDDFYQPVTEERLHSSIEQSKAMEYAGHEIIFF